MSIEPRTMSPKGGAPGGGKGSNISRPLIILLIIVGFFVLLAMLASVSRQFFYFFEQINQDEVGVQFESGRIKNVVGPGVYSDTGLFVDLKRVSSKAVPFEVEDAELITRDKQRIGLVVTGDIFRPTMAESQQLRDLWPKYNALFLNDEAARNQVIARARQAMKVCVGDRNFDDAVIGTGRDVLRDCIDDELDKLSLDFGLNTANVAVPEVMLSPEVQIGLDRIVQLRLETEQARQDQLKAQAQANAEQARQEGEIRIAQSRIQEESRQQITLSQLNEDKLLSQKAVIEAERANELARVEAERAIIEAEKSNELLGAQRDLEIQKARRGCHRSREGRHSTSGCPGGDSCEQPGITPTPRCRSQCTGTPEGRQDYLHARRHHTYARVARTRHRADGRYHLRSTRRGAQAAATGEGQ
ncbi:MAG: SPFH domain-containing protein [Anaerolineales bacterium]|nr:SPFH domain-containing protein [Anaerolineales bacterium]